MKSRVRVVVKAEAAEQHLAGADAEEDRDEVVGAARVSLNMLEQRTSSS